MNPCERTLMIRVACGESPAGVVDAMLGDMATAARRQVNELERDGPVKLHNFSYSIEGCAAEEQAVFMSDAFDVEDWRLEDLLREVESKNAGEVRSREVDQQIRYLCRTLGAERMVKFLEAIGRKKE